MTTTTMIPLTAKTKRKTDLEKGKPTTKGLTAAVEVAPGTVATVDAIDGHLGLDPVLQGQAEAVLGPAPGPVLLTEAERDAPLVQGANQGTVQGHLDESASPGRLAQGVGPGLVPVLGTGEGERGRGAGHMTDHETAEERGPGQGRMREGGATVHVLVHEIVTGEVQPVEQRASGMSLLEW